VPHDVGPGSIPVSAAFVGHATKDNVCLFATPAVGKIYRWDYGTSDDGTSIELVVRTGHLDHGDQHGWKRIGSVYVAAASSGTGPFGFRQSIDRDGVWTLHDATVTAGAYTRVRIPTPPFQTRYRSMGFRCEN